MCVVNTSGLGSSFKNSAVHASSNDESDAISSGRSGAPTGLQKRLYLFSTFPYVCPEPVLTNSSFI
jgi:hypothetical protein